MKNSTQLQSPQDRITFCIIGVSCLCLILQLYSIPRRITIFMSLANKIMLFLWLGVGGFFVIRKVANRLPQYMFCVIWLLIFVAFSSVFSVLTAGGSMTSNISAIVNFLVFPLMLLYAALFGIPKQAKTVVLLTNIIISLVFVDLYFSSYRNVYTGYYGITRISAVTLGYPNPNQTAMFLFACIVALGVGVFYFKRIIVKLLLTLDLVLLCKMLFETESRTAFLVILVFFLLILLNHRLKITNKWIFWSILIPVIYALCALFFRTFFKETTFLGESLFNGREQIYDRFLKNLNFFNFLLGDFNRFRFDNLHNSYISIVATAGIFSLFSFVLFVKRGLEKNLSSLISDRYARVAFIGVLSTIIYSSSEAAYFVGGVTYAFLVFVPYIMFSVPYASDK